MALNTNTASQILRKPLVKTRRVQPKTIIKLQLTIESFTSKPSLSPRPELQFLEI